MINDIQFLTQHEALSKGFAQTNTEYGSKIVKSLVEQGRIKSNGVESWVLNLLFLVFISNRSFQFG